MASSTQSSDAQQKPMVFKPSLDMLNKATKGLSHRKTPSKTKEEINIQQISGNSQISDSPDYLNVSEISNGSTNSDISTKSNSNDNNSLDDDNINHYQIDNYDNVIASQGRRLSELIGCSDDIKILFLDVDGVLNYQNSESRLCLPQMLRLKKIIDSTNCKIVLSTSWRISPKRRERLLNALLTEVSIDVNNIVIGCTPTFRGQYGYKHRPLEIYEYLTHDLELKVYNHYNVVSWVAIDDLELNDFNNNIMKGHFVKTDLKKGLTDQNVNQAIEILNKSDKKEHIRLKSYHKHVRDVELKQGLELIGVSKEEKESEQENQDILKPSKHGRFVSRDKNVNFTLTLNDNIKPLSFNDLSIISDQNLHKIDRIGIKILFLNIDGVLNYDGYISQVNGGISPDHLLRLAKILSLTKCKIVFSTSRRIQELHRQKVLKQFERRLDKNIWNYDICYLGDTPQLDFQHRPLEIQKFLDDIENHPFFINNFDNFVNHDTKINNNTDNSNENNNDVELVKVNSSNQSSNDTIKSNNTSIQNGTNINNNVKKNVKKNKNDNESENKTDIVIENENPNGNKTNIEKQKSNKKVFFDILSWCAVDDIPLDKINTECWNIMNGRFVRTNMKVGMTDENVKQVITILNETDGKQKYVTIKDTTPTSPSSNDNKSSNNVVHVSSNDDSKIDTTNK